MNAQLLRGVLAGAIFGAVSVAMMLPLSFPDKRAALLAAFASRFGIGLAVSCIELPLPGWAIGLGFGLLLSLPDAVITKGYAPILIVGGLGGALIGGFVHGWTAHP